MLSFSRRREARFLAAFALIGLIVVGWAACGSSVDSHGTGGGGGSGGVSQSGGSSPNGGSTPTGGGMTNNGGSTMSSGGGSGQGGSPAMCDAACGDPFKCCGETCTAPYNDIKNCGGCNKECGGAHPYCDQGHCANQPPCTPGGPVCDPPGFCCGSTCCGANQLCCDVPEGVETGPKCVTLKQGENTCPQGCPLCQ